MQHAFRTANKLDAEEIAHLVNRAYRPEPDAAGWTHEADLVYGNRASAGQVAEIISKPDSLMLVGLNGLEIVACVHIEKDGSSSHIGMFAVNPARQGAGAGKQMLAYAEEQANLVFGAEKFVMFVLSARTELIAFYLRRGYQQTGLTMDYPLLADAGKPKQTDLKVEVLEKLANLTNKQTLTPTLDRRQNDMKFRLYRYQPESGQKPSMQEVELDIDPNGKMLLDALLELKAQDDTLAFRRSCREGVCGSDAVNANGRNVLACITPLSDLKQPIEIRPLPGLPVIRDFVVDMEPFYRQYKSIKPWLVNNDPEPERERLQTPEERAELDGAVECILCGACTSSCPSFWWHPDKFVGPAGLLQAWRFIADSRDQATEERLDYLEDTYRLYRCRGIMNCVEVCPKGLNPTEAIGKIKSMLVRRKV